MMDALRVVPPRVMWGILLCLTAVGAQNDQPRIDIPPRTTTVVVRGTTILTCKVANRGTYTVNWIKSGVVISSNELINPSHVPPTRYSIVGDTNRGNYSLKITDVITSDKATYQCQLRAPGSGGSDIVSNPVNLIVLHPPSNEFPQCSPDSRGTMALLVGEQVAFGCTTENGEPKASLNWTLDGAELESVVDESTPGLFRLTFARNMTVEDDRRRFVCTLTHELLPEPRTCQVGPLDVVFSPVETLITSRQPTPEVDGTLVIFCEAKANPLPTAYNWYVFPPSDEVRESQADRIMDSGFNAWVLSDVKSEDEGTVVVCEAVNERGALNASFTISVIEHTTAPPPPTKPIEVTSKRLPPATSKPSTGDTLSTPLVVILIMIAVALLLLTVALVIFVVKRKKQPTSAVITVTDLDNIHADVHSLASFGNISRHGTPYLDRVDYELGRSRSHSRDNMSDNISLDSASALVSRSYSRDSPTHRKYSVDSLGKPLHYNSHHHYREDRPSSNGSPVHRPAKRLDSSPEKERKPSDSAHSQAGRPLPKIGEPVQQNEYAELTPVAARKQYDQSQVSVTSPESGFGEDDALIKPQNATFSPQSSNNCNCGRKMSHVEV